MTEYVDDEVLHYRSGRLKDEEGICAHKRIVTHTYAKTEKGLLYPMCRRGLNRGDGFRIQSGLPGTEGTCKVCIRRKAEGLKPFALRPG